MANITINVSLCKRMHYTGATFAEVASVEAAPRHAWVLAVQFLEEEAMWEVLDSILNIRSETLM